MCTQPGPASQRVATLGVKLAHQRAPSSHNYIKDHIRSGLVCASARLGRRTDVDAMLQTARSSGAGCRSRQFRLEHARGRRVRRSAGQLGIAQVMRYDWALQAQQRAVLRTDDRTPSHLSTNRCLQVPAWARVIVGMGLL